MDPVIQIANIVTKYGEKKPFVRNVFCLDTTSPIVATQIMSFSDERQMLSSWRDFLEKVDPDIITGYNIANFDFPYLLDRAKHLKVQTLSTGLAPMSNPSRRRRTSPASRWATAIPRQPTPMAGCSLTYSNWCSVITSSEAIRSIPSLLTSSSEKEDVHHTMITELFNGTPESRRRLALYCLKDAYLPQRLMDKLSCLENYTEMARVTGVPFNFLLAREAAGQVHQPALPKGVGTEARHT